jgi:putative ABC transport system permease protein
MFWNYLTIACRIFSRRHRFSLVNLFGLAIGLSSVMLIITHIGFELSFDRHFSNSDRIFQLVMESNDMDQRTVDTPIPLGNTLVREFFEIESSTALFSFKSHYLVDNSPVRLNEISVNPNFFEIFDLPIIKGNTHNALNDESGVVLTQSTAEKLFPGSNPVGKIMSRKSYDGSKNYYTITAVVQDIPANTHFTADIISSEPVSDKNSILERTRPIPNMFCLNPIQTSQRCKQR